MLVTQYGRVLKVNRFVVKRLVSGRKVVKFETGEELSGGTSAWFEPCEDRQGYIDFKVNGISTWTEQDEETPVDEFASKWMQAFGADAEVDAHGRVSYVSRSTRSRIYQRALQSMRMKYPQFINENMQFAGDFEDFVSNIQ